MSIFERYKVDYNLDTLEEARIEAIEIAFDELDEIRRRIYAIKSEMYEDEGYTKRIILLDKIQSQLERMDELYELAKRNKEL